MKQSLQFAGLALAGLACGLALLAPLVRAQETHVSREGNAWGQVVTGSLAAVKNLHVKVDAGSVLVHGSSQSGIDYSFHTLAHGSSEEEARRQFQSYKVTTYVRGDTAWVVGEWRGQHIVHIGPARMSPAEFVINVPRDTELIKVETGGGGVETSGISGRVEIETGGGKIRVDDIGGSVKAQTGGDMIDVGTVGGDVKLETGGGNIAIRSVKGNIHAETGGGNVMLLSGGQGADVEAGAGNVEIKQCLGRVKATTGGGNVDLGDIGGAAEVDTGGGSIRLTSAKGTVRAQTGGGTIDLFGVPSAHVETGAGGITMKLVNTGAERHDSVVETSAGDITIYIASDVAVTVRANVDMGSGHRIISELTDIHIASEGEQWGPKTLSAEGSLNGGGPVLKVRTSSGNIYFKRASR